MKITRHKINELERDNGRTRYWHYVRRFFHLYTKDERDILQWHFETIVRKKDRSFSARFHVGNAGSETPWDGHLLIFGAGFFWGFSGLRKLAARISKCSQYAWDARDWEVRISDGSLYWQLGAHTDACRVDSRSRQKKDGTYRRRSWRRGSLNLSIPEAIWGPKRYSYTDVDSFPTLIKLPEGEYAVIITLQKQFYGRTKVSATKHIQTWSLDVDAPRGIPTHHDKSGGWKGDRSYGFGVAGSTYTDVNDWKQDAEALVTARVLEMRGRSGFREPQVQEGE